MSVENTTDEAALPPTTGSRSANARFVDEKMKADPSYAPYCLQPGCMRMRRVSPSRAECSCGSYHEIPENKLITHSREI